MHAELLEVLEKASVSSTLARAIVRAIEIEIEIAGAKDTLATKHDFLVLRQEIERLRSEMAQLATQLRSEMTQLRSEMAQLATQLRSEMAQLGAELHAEIHRAVSGSTRQMYMALLGHMAMTLAFIYFLMTQLR